MPSLWIHCLVKDDSEAFVSGQLFAGSCCTAKFIEFQLLFHDFKQLFSKFILFTLLCFCWKSSQRKSDLLKRAENSATGCRSGTVSDYPASQTAQLGWAEFQIRFLLLIFLVSCSSWCWQEHPQKWLFCLLLFWIVGVILLCFLLVHSKIWGLAHPPALVSYSWCDRN